MLMSHTTVVVNGKLTLDPIFDFEENTIFKLITKNNHNVFSRMRGGNGACHFSVATFESRFIGSFGRRRVLG